VASSKPHLRLPLRRGVLCLAAMSDLSQLWIKRARELLSSQGLDAFELTQGAISMLTALYGQKSTQLQGFMAGIDVVKKTASGAGNAKHHLGEYAYSAIRNAKAELEAGLITSVRALVTGEVLVELVGLAKEVLREGSEAAKNVAAVLTAAAFEDLIRRMGEEFADVRGRPNLQEVVIALKDADILRGGQVGTAQSYLPFRNDSLHADWEKVDRSQVQSCIGFVEELLTKHFS